MRIYIQDKIRRTIEYRFKEAIYKSNICIINVSMINVPVQIIYYCSKLKM